MLKLMKHLFSGSPSCQKVNSFIADYLDDELDPETRRKFVDHVADCNSCHAFLEEYKATVDFVRNSEAIEPPQELVEKTLAFLESRLSTEPTD
jgi:anti-sigma factor RsiW